MVGPITTALTRSRGAYNTARQQALMVRQQGGSLDISPGGSMGGLSSWRDQGANRQRYALNRGWVGSAVLALALRGAPQPVCLGRTVRSTKSATGRTYGGVKASVRAAMQRMPTHARTKAAREEFEVIQSHELLDRLERPNTIQNRWQFTFSHIGNMAFTGWSFIVKDETEDGQKRYYSLPTTWVQPIHDKGPFAEFKIVNPKNPASAADQKPIDGSQVAFTFIPNPSDPFRALSPAELQASAIKIDEHIQSSQTVHFENGVFPSVIVTVGSNPHPDARFGADGRPRLTAGQRRQVNLAIRKTMQGVANYSNPAIIDGFIEKIERLSATQNEMGWDKSEDKVRDRILSVFGVHPFILGMPLNVGGYAQAYVIDRNFCGRVNTFLDLLGIMMTELARTEYTDEDLFVWWEECQAVDPQREDKMWIEGLKHGDIGQNEFRARLGLPPDEDTNQQLIIPQSVGPVMNVAQAVTSGRMTPGQAQAIFRAMGLPDDYAREIAGEGAVDPLESEALETLQAAVATLQRPLLEV